MVTIPEEFDLTQFKLAWATIIAIAWSDPNFESSLYQAGPAEIRAKFAMYLNFDLPDDLDITVVKSDPSQGWDAKNQRWNLTSPATVRLQLPPKPDVKEQAVALANYQSMSRHYPLSCCC